LLNEAARLQRRQKIGSRMESVGQCGLLGLNWRDV
jgi:hypothetical protein